MSYEIINFFTSALRCFLIIICVHLTNNNTVFQQLIFILGIWQLIEIIHSLTYRLRVIINNKFGKNNKL